MNLWQRVSSQYDEALEWDQQSSQWQRPTARISRAELLYGLANRLLYSTAYNPSGFYITLEYFINLALVAEVGIRMLAQRKQYFHYVANIIDVFIVLFCMVTLVLLHRECTVGSELEKVLDTSLLVFRNSVQFFRLFMMLKRNQENMNARQMYINIDDDVEAAHQAAASSAHEGQAGLPWPNATSSNAPASKSFQDVDFAF